MTELSPTARRAAVPEDDRSAQRPTGRAEGERTVGPALSAPGTQIRLDQLIQKHALWHVDLECREEDTPV